MTALGPLRGLVVVDEAQRRSALRGAREVLVRKVRSSIAMSLDGFIPGPQGEFDWIPMDSFLALGLVDEVQSAIVPILLGASRPFLPSPSERAHLKLAQHRVYPRTGTVLLGCEVTGSARQG